MFAFIKTNPSMIYALYDYVIALYDFQTPLLIGRTRTVFLRCFHNIFHNSGFP